MTRSRLRKGSVSELVQRMILENPGKYTVAKLSKELGCETGAVSSALNFLGKNGLIISSGLRIREGKPLEVENDKLRDVFEIMTNNQDEYFTSTEIVALTKCTNASYTIRSCARKYGCTVHSRKTKVRQIMEWKMKLPDISRERHAEIFTIRNPKECAYSTAKTFGVDLDFILKVKEEANK